MYDYKQVDLLIEQWKKQGLPKDKIIVNLANACLGWSYVWGSLGQVCTTSVRKSYINSSNIASGDKDLIKKRCPILSGKQSVCAGCVYYPNNVGSRVFDCRGFTRWLFNQVGISINGGGATSQWNDANNWAQKGTIDTLPKDKVCCIFRYYSSSGKMEHTLLYDGEGNYIHASGEVKKQKINTYSATHWAIPKGLYDGGGTPMPEKGYATVTARNVALRRGPTTDAGVILRVPISKNVKLETPPDDWAYVSYNGKTGYMMKKYLKEGE